MSNAPLDAVIVGGSFAGLAAALQLGRASRRTLVIDAGSPRNRYAAAAHGVPGWDGSPPAEILNRFRSDLAAYPSVRILRDTACDLRGALDDFTLMTDGGEQIEARRVVLAHGVRDVLPAIPGLADGWGRTVLHCPYCHGYEVKGRPLAVLANGPMAVHQTTMLRADWSDDVTLLANGIAELEMPDPSSTGPKVEIRLPLAMVCADGVRVAFAEGFDAQFAAVFVASQVDLSASPAAALGLAMGEGPLGPFVQVGPMMQTSVPGIFAAGDLASPAHSVNVAVGNGAMAGVGCHQSLLFPGLVQPVGAPP